MRVAVVSSLVCAGAAFAQQAEVAPNLGVLILLKVLTYDASFDARGEGNFVVLVPFSKGREARSQSIEAELAGLEVKSIKQRRLVFERVLAGEPLLGHAVLLTGALAAEETAKVVKQAHSVRVYTLALNERDVQAGALLGVAPSGAKLQPVVNVTTAKQLGAEFAASVLKVSRTVGAGR